MLGRRMCAEFAKHAHNEKEIKQSICRDDQGRYYNVYTTRGTRCKRMFLTGSNGSHAKVEKCEASCK